MSVASFSSSMTTKLLKVVLALAFAAGSGYVLYTQAAPLLVAPCSTPIEYAIGDIDPRFGVSESELKVALAKAAAVWNTAAGKTIVATSSTETGIPVSLVYGEEQKAVELGTKIDNDQASYDAKKAEVLSLRAQFSAAKSSYESAKASYEKKAAAYDAEVKSWNAKGGAPPAEYQKLKAESATLEKQRSSLNASADAVNDFAERINLAVAALNDLARKINARVTVYNKSAGTDFEQGNYAEDGKEKSIHIFELKSQADMTRVLTHELGHALGMDHVENPDSIMYSFNIGDGLEPTDEDVTELKRVCRLEN